MVTGVPLDGRVCSGARIVMTGEVSRKRLEILVVDDNPSDVHLLTEAFQELNADLKLSVARDGAEALKLIQRGTTTDTWRPDLILLDLNLPKITGHEVLARLKNDPATRNIPVIVFTSSRAETDVKRAYDAHANAYVKKPTSLDGLMAAMRGLKVFWMETAQLPSQIPYSSSSTS
jgi:two-component system, chemotaxis family, response regulator Rcp1